MSFILIHNSSCSQDEVRIKWCKSKRACNEHKFIYYHIVWFFHCISWIESPRSKVAVMLPYSYQQQLKVLTIWVFLTNLTQKMEFGLKIKIVFSQRFLHHKLPTHKTFQNLKGAAASIYKKKIMDSKVWGVEDFFNWMKHTKICISHIKQTDTGV